MDDRLSVAVAVMAVIGILLVAGCVSETAEPQAPRTLLAVFAHPDDELTVAPALSRYAREGVRVLLAFATGGEQGVAPHAGIPAGPGLAAARANEVRCAASALGIAPPILLGFRDGQLASESTLRALERELRDLFERDRPDSVVTWGPDGGYGHPDHRLVGAVVTQIVQAGGPGVPRALFYPGFSHAQLDAHGRPAGLPWIGLAADLLTVRIELEPQDLVAMRSVFACHATQFPAARVPDLAESSAERLEGQVSFRPWRGSSSGDDLFGELRE